MQQHPRIAFAGPAGSGKTTWANHLVKTYGYERERFAATIYDGISQIFDVTEAEILADKNFWRPVLQAFGTAVVRNPEARKWSNGEILSRLLKDVGSLGRATLYTYDSLTRMRNYFETHPYGVPDAFIQLTTKRLRENFAPGSAIALDDCRFVNEAAGLHDHGFLLVRLNCSQEICLERLLKRDGKADPRVFEDPSEREWSLLAADHEIDAHGSTEDVRRQVDALIARHKDLKIDRERQGT